jgi:hypothetical protein
MVIDDFHIVSIRALPSKADTPLIVDPNTHLPCPVPLQAL